MYNYKSDRIIIMKNSSIFAGRQSMLGDVIVYLPFLNWIEKTNPNSFKIYSLARKSSNIIPFLVNHPMIDRIQVSQPTEGLGPNDAKIMRECDRIFNPNPPITNDLYYNNRDIIEETFLMNQEFDKMGFWKNCVTLQDWNDLPLEDKTPSLNQWFETERLNKTVAIWPFAGYGNRTVKRSPSKEWWYSLSIDLFKMGYKIFHFGHPSNPIIGKPVENLTHLSFFDSIKMTLGCDFTIQSDTGASWIIGAYGFKQMVVYTNYMPNHTSNFDAYLCTNKNNNLIPFFKENDIDAIKQDDILAKIKDF